MNTQTIQSIIETLEYTKRIIGDENEVLMKPIDESIHALRQALAQPEQDNFRAAAEIGKEMK